jgi:hypothetical protein
MPWRNQPFLTTLLHGSLLSRFPPFIPYSFHCKRSLERDATVVTRVAVVMHTQPIAFCGEQTRCERSRLMVCATILPFSICLWTFFSRKLSALFSVHLPSQDSRKTSLRLCSTQFPLPLLPWVEKLLAGRVHFLEVSSVCIGSATANIQ